MFAVFHFRQFGMQSVLRHEPEAWQRAVALVDPAATVPRVMDATESARSEGVTDGLTAPQALARCRRIEVRHRSVAAEGLATEAMVQAAFGFSPNVEVTAAGVLTLDLTGLTALTGPAGEEAIPGWATRVREAMGTLGLRVVVGVGLTPNLARYAAVWGGQAFPGATRGEGWCRVTEAREFVGALPVLALGPSSDVTEILRRWGIRTVGECLALGQAALADRLGLEALGLFAAASTTASRPLRLVSPAERFEEVHRFETPIETLEPLLFLLRRFVDSLSRRLESVGWAAGTLGLRLVLESGERVERPLRLPQPTSRGEVMFRVLHTQMEGVRTASAVVEVGLVIAPARPEQKQFSLFEPVLRDPHQFEETLARLVALVGADRVGSPRREDSHRSDAFTLARPDFDAPPPMAEEEPELLRAVPVRRHRPPVRVEVEVGVGGPRSIRGGGWGGGLKGVLGPWRSSGRWWEGGEWRREEWEVGTREGRVVRLVREGAEWRVEGELD